MRSAEIVIGLVWCKSNPEHHKQMLVNQRRELEEDKIIERPIYVEIPPRVEYKITQYGQSLMPVIGVIQEWGLKDLSKAIK